MAFGHALSYFLRQNVSTFTKSLSKGQPYKEAFNSLAIFR